MSEPERRVVEFAYRVLPQNQRSWIRCDFKEADYSGVTLGYVDDEIVKSLRKKIQSSRHSSEGSLKERSGFTDEQKVFLVVYGAPLSWFEVDAKRGSVGERSFLSAR